MMNLTTISILIALLLLAPASGNAQQQFRSLQGSIVLDVPVARKDRVLDISVRNHSIVVVPPSFTVIRPITSKQSVQVTLPAGMRSVDYNVDQILLDAVDYSIEIRCQDCASRIPTQYYSPQGNRFGLANEVYIDPDDLPERLDITARTNAIIQGSIAWVDPMAGDRDLLFVVDTVSTANPNFPIGSTTAVLAMNNRKVTYTIDGLSRTSGGANFQVRLRCTNCVGTARRQQVFGSLLSPDLDHDKIDFLVSDTPPIIVPVVMYLLSD